MSLKLIKMQRHVPSVFRPSANINIKGLLTAWATEDDLTVAAIFDAKEQLYVATAQLDYLDALANNVGVFRPQFFNLSDTLFRQLVPLLSYRPKQVVPTIYSVLEIFFGAANPDILVNEISPNELNIQIPSAIVAFRRSLKGATHLHCYNGTITAIDNSAAKLITVDMYGDSKVLGLDELVDGTFGQGNESEEILGNATGSTGVDFHFSEGADLTKFATGQFVATHPTYLGSYIPNPDAFYTVTKLNGVLGENLTAGSSSPGLLVMTDASEIPDAGGYLSIGFGGQNEEMGIAYYSRPNNGALSIDPAYTFLNNHVAGEIVNVVVRPYQEPRLNGDDYSAYLADVLFARILAQEIVESLVAAGVVINWTIVGPVINC